MKGTITTKTSGLNYVINTMIELKDLAFALLPVSVKLHTNEIWQKGQVNMDLKYVLSKPKNKGRKKHDLLIPTRCRHRLRF